MPMNMSDPMYWRERAAQEWALKVKGWGHARGGWPRDLATDRTLGYQGWTSVWHAFRDQIVDWFVKGELGETASFQELVNTHPSYRPTLRTFYRGKRAWRVEVIANAFDSCMDAQGSARRAWRGGGEGERHYADAWYWERPRTR